MTDIVRVAVVNSTSDQRLSDDDVASGIAALQAQVDDDLFGAWGVRAELFYLNPPRPYPNVFGLRLTDAKSENATSPAFPEHTSWRLPLANVFLGDHGPGQDWTHLASRNLLNLLVNPIVGRLIYRSVGHRPHLRHYMYVHDITSACGGYDHGYTKEGRQVSNFVYREWFTDQRPVSTRPTFDQTARIHAGFHVLPGGVAFAYDLLGEKWIAIEIDRATGQLREIAREPSGIRGQQLVKLMQERNVPRTGTSPLPGYPGGP